MRKANHNEFNPPINPKLLFSLVRNTPIHVVPRKTYSFSLTICTWGMFNEEKTIILYLVVFFLSLAVLLRKSSRPI
jgi:hypothetical protein